MAKQQKDHKKTSNSFRDYLVATINFSQANGGGIFDGSQIFPQTTISTSSCHGSLKQKISSKIQFYSIKFIL